MMSPSFNRQAIEWTNDLWKEMESYWNDLGEKKELDLVKWMHRFTNEIIFGISTGVKIIPSLPIIIVSLILKLKIR